MMTRSERALESILWLCRSTMTPEEFSRSVRALATKGSLKECRVTALHRWEKRFPEDACYTCTTCDAVGLEIPPVAKPKGKKKTFYRAIAVPPGGLYSLKRTDGSTDCVNKSWDAAVAYMQDNPGSIIEIVVRKPEAGSAKPTPVGE